MFRESFEDGLYKDTFTISNRPKGTAIDVSRAKAKHGKRSLAIDFGSASQDALEIVKDIGSAEHQRVVSAWIYPNSNRYKIQFGLVGPRGKVVINYNTYRSIIVQTSQNPYGIASSLPPDRWYLFSLRTFPELNEVEILVESQLHYQHANIPATLDFNTLIIRVPKFQGGSKFYIDDVVYQSK